MNRLLRLLVGFYLTLMVFLGFLAISMGVADFLLGGSPYKPLLVVVLYIIQLFILVWYILRAEIFHDV